MSKIEATTVGHLEHLAVQIGSRPLGSKRNQMATEFVASTFKTSGLQTELEEFACPLWENAETRLELNGKRYVAAANTFSSAA